MRVAVIDLGTHNALLMIAEIQGKNFSILRQEQRIIALGKGIGSTGRILDESVKRAVEALKEYREIAKSYGVEKVKLAATAVLRDPINASDVVKKIESGSGFTPYVISGEEEARYVYLAGCRTFSYPSEKTVIDIGGGSVEFVQGCESAISRAHSLPVGAVKITEKFISTFPVKRSEVEFLREHLAKCYQKELKGFNTTSNRRFIGVAGTFTTAAAMIQELSNYDPALITGFELERNAVNTLLGSVETMSIDEQMNIPGLHPKRAGFIVAGLVLISSFYDYFGIDKITVSDEGLRYGILLDWMAKENLG